MSDSVERARAALLHLYAGCDRATWVAIGMSFRAAGGDLETWLDWCATGSNYGGEREARAVWRSFKVTGGISPATLFRAAIDAGWSGSSPANNSRSARACARGESAHKSLAESASCARVCAESERPMRATLDPRWDAYWQSLGPVRGTGRAYLEARQCALPPEDGALRFDPAGHHRSGYRGPCLVALVTDVMTCAPISLHRTWVNADGKKAAIEPPRMLLGGHRKAGGVIRLWPDEAVTHGLAVAEGIETSLSLAQACRPAWALIDAGNLARLAVLHGIEALTIAVDDDFAGISAANECAERWANEDREVTLVGGSRGS